MKCLFIAFPVKFVITISFFYGIFVSGFFLAKEIVIRSACKIQANDEDTDWKRD